jgi:uncharacterized membrane protein YccC
VSRAGALVRAITVDPGALGTAVRAAATVAVCVAVGQAIDQPVLGLFAAIGALNVAVADTGGPYAERMASMVVGLAGICAALAAGAALSRTPWVAVAALAVVAFLAGLVRTYGPVGAKVGLVTTIAFLLSSGIPGPWSAVWQRPVASVAGGLGAILLMVWSWPFRPDRATRQRLEEAFTALARLAKACASGDAAEIKSARGATRTAREGVRRELDSLGAWSPTEDASVRRLADLGLEAGRLDASLCLLARALATEGPPTPEVAASSLAVAEDAEAVAAALDERDTTLDSGSFHRPEEKAPSPPRPDSRPTLALAALALAREHSRTALALASRLETPVLLRPFMWRSASTAASGVARTVRLELRPGSTGFRHAVQLAVATAAANSIGLSYGLDRAYWAPLTATVVLQPSYRLTARRTIDRIVGTLVGALVGAAVLAEVSGEVGLDLLIFAAGLATFFFLARQANRASVVAMTMLVLCLIETIDPSSWELAKYRVVDTLVGAGAALVVAALLRWRPDSLATGRELALPVEAARDYLAACLDEEAAPGTHESLLLARRRLDDALARTEGLAEPLDATGATRARNLVTATRRFADSAQVVELLASGSAAQEALLRSVCEQVIVALDELAGSLGQGAPAGVRPDFDPALRTLQTHATSGPDDSPELGQARRLVESAESMAAAAVG